MTDRFATCLPRILVHEGGWVDDPRDPGGATMKGVTIAVFAAFKGRAVSKPELRAISDADLAAIYRKKYWDAAHCGQLPAGVDYAVFDYAVNSGPGRAVRALQAAAGVSADGSIGPNTLAAVGAHSATDLINGIASRREAFYRSLATFQTFGVGWMRRLREVTATALKDAHP